jgi:hypothetical protein
MAKSYLQLQQQFKFDALIESLASQFALLLDVRASNARYPLAGVLKSGVALCSLTETQTENYCQILVRLDYLIMKSGFP